jgi:hypothetical protein
MEAPSSKPPHTNESLRAAVKEWRKGKEHRVEIESKWGGSITHWNTSNVTDMSYMFAGSRTFNQPLAWDTRSVTNMNGMFWASISFNNGGKPLAFDTRNVTTMSCMFLHASVFNQPLAFDTRNVTTLEHMFGITECFNQPLAWDTRSVMDMDYMFSDALAFSQPLAFDMRSTKCTPFCMFHHAKGGRLDRSPAAIAATLATSDARRVEWDIKYAREALLSRRCCRLAWHWRRVAAERSYAPEGVGRKRDRAAFEEDFAEAS